MASERSVRIRGDPGLDRETEFVQPVTHEKVSSLIWQFGLLILLWAAMAIFNAASPDHLSWHQRTPSYDVFLGVVPASIANQDENLVQLHRMAPHGTAKLGRSTYHVLVSIFRPSGMERVVDASVVAEIVENDLIHVKRTKKPLEMMSMAGAVTYCNFFDLHWNGKYRIHVRIHEPGKSSEKVTFLQEVYGLPK